MERDRRSLASGRLAGRRCGAAPGERRVGGRPREHRDVFGTTSEHDPVTFKVVSGGHAITNFKTTLKLALRAQGEVTGTASGNNVTGKVVQFLHGKVKKCYVETFTARAT
jgi:hypothetical protein